MIIEKYNYSNLRKAIGCELWKERQKASISQRSLALKLSLLPKEIDKIELGKNASFVSVGKMLKYYNKKIKLGIAGLNYMSPRARREVFLIKSPERCLDGFEMTIILLVMPRLRLAIVKASSNL